MILRLFLGSLVLVVLACSSPTPPATAEAASSRAAPYPWPASIPRYFPVDATELSVNDSSTTPRTAFPDAIGCRREYELAAQCLAAFKAPVLYNKLNKDNTYRFLWLRAFGPPILLTLECTNTGGILRTQYLNKVPNLTASFAPPPPPFATYARGRTTSKQRRLQWRKDSSYIDSVYRVELAYSQAPIKLTEARAASISSVQLQQLNDLISEATFYRLSSCEINDVLDGAYWFLEARDTGRYHVVYRHSPEENDKFRRCCELLLDWSAAHREERY